MVHSQISQSKSYPSNERVLTAEVRPQESQHTPLLPPTADGAEVEAPPVPLKPRTPPGAAHLVVPLALPVAPPLSALQQPIGMLDWVGPEVSRGAWSVCKVQHWESVPKTGGNRLAQLPQSAFEETLAGGRKPVVKDGGRQCIGRRDLRECLQENARALILQREDESMTQTKQTGLTSSEIMPRAVVRKQRRNRCDLAPWGCSGCPRWSPHVRPVSGPVHWMERSRPWLRFGPSPADCAGPLLSSSIPTHAPDQRTNR